ncbi:hypothetical protein KKG52_01200, partial [Patescibacteria group bacterium]|nr:hypothetical protein [Patescibacteria group bacterium]
KIIFGTIVSVFALAVIVAPASAVKPNGPSAVNGLANPGTSHLYLYEKDADWQVVDKGGVGKLSFDVDSFVFNGHGLNANTDYTLINYDEAWSTGQDCLASGTSNKGGNINLAGGAVGTGKIWLVLSSDVDCGTDSMTGWNPSEYLFEYALLI